MKLSRLAPAALAALLLLTGCPDRNRQETADTTATEETAMRAAPAFNADSAYAFTAKQVAFGPRVPNSPAHVACGDWMVGEFKRMGLTVREQPFEAMALDGKMLRARNIIAQFASPRPPAGWPSSPTGTPAPSPTKTSKPLTPRSMAPATAPAV